MCCSVIQVSSQSFARQRLSMPSWGERLGSIESIDRRPLGAGQICKDALEATTPGTLGVGMIPPPIIE